MDDERWCVGVDRRAAVAVDAHFQVDVAGRSSFVGTRVNSNFFRSVPRERDLHAAGVACAKREVDGNMKPFLNVRWRRQICEDRGGAARQRDRPPGLVVIDECDEGVCSTAGN